MDSLTQIVLGASVAEATLGKKNVADMSLDDIDSRLAYYLKADKSQIDHKACFH